MKWLQSKHRRLLLGKSPCSHDRLPLTSDYKFDSDSGQMFTEGTISTQSFEERDWTRPCFLSRKPHSGIQSAKDTRSLRDTAIEVAVENLLDLTFEGVSCLPISAVLKIWQLANERYHVPFSVWIIFSKVLRDEKDVPLNILRFSDLIDAPRQDLSTYTKALNSPSFEFLTYISISTLLSVPELVKLSSVKNLGILEVIHNFRAKHQSSVTDRLIRAWYQATIDDGAFPVLRVLKLCNHKELTEKSLRYISSFPALALFEVRGCTFDTGSRATGRTLGWRSTLDNGVLAFFDTMCVERSILMRAHIQAKPRPIRRVPSQPLSDHERVIRLPRSEVAGFLTNTGRPTTPADPTLEWTVWEKDSRFLERPSTSSSTSTLRFNRLDGRSHFTNPSETWNFIPSAIFTRIGELRNDRDLLQAGVPITDSATVKEELISTVPMVCLHLGPNHAPLNPLLPNNPIKNFYGNAYSESSSPASPHLTGDRPGEEMFRFPNYLARDCPDPRNIAFYRIKAPGPNPISLDTVVNSEAKGETKRTKRRSSPLVLIENSARRVGIGKSRSMNTVPVNGDGDALRASMESPERKRGSLAGFGKRLMQNKKQKLGDVLGSFT